MKTKNNKISPLSIMIVSIVAIVLLLSATLAAFFRTVGVTEMLSVSNFKSEGIVSFEGGAPVSNYVTDTKDKRAVGYLVSLNPEDPNYIGKLRVSVKYAGSGVGLIRVRVLEEFSSLNSENVRTVSPFSMEIPYIIDSSAVYNTTSGGNQKAWFDNRTEDYSFYYATPVRCLNSSTETTVPLITGLDVSQIDLGVVPSGTQVRIMIETDVVQVNRYPQFWGITKLPWANDANSATEETL